MSEGLFCLLMIVICVAGRFLSKEVIKRLDVPGRSPLAELSTLRKLAVAFILRLILIIAIALTLNYFLGAYESYDSCIIAAAALWLGVNLFMGLVFDAVNNRRKSMPQIDPSRICRHCGGIIDDEYDFCKACGAKLKGNERIVRDNEA